VVGSSGGAQLRLEVFLGGLEDAAVLHVLAAPVSDGERGDRAGADAAERGGGGGGGGQVAHAVAVHGHGGSAAAPRLHPRRPLGARHEHRPEPLTNRLSGNITLSPDPFRIAIVLYAHRLFKHTVSNLSLDHFFLKETLRFRNFV
jgi:hypothetical protein